MCLHSNHTLMLEILKSGKWIVLGLSWVFIFEGKMVHFHSFTRCTKCKEIILPEKIKILHWQLRLWYICYPSNSTLDRYFNVQFMIILLWMISGESKWCHVTFYTLYMHSFMYRAEYTYSQTDFQRFPHYCTKALSKK